MALSDDARPYSRTPEFTELSVPAGLLKGHRTIITAQTPPGIVEPTIVHSVEPLGPVRFYVEFHHRPVRE